MVTRGLEGPARQGLLPGPAWGLRCIVALLIWAWVSTAWAQHAGHGSTAPQRRAPPALAMTSPAWAYRVTLIPWARTQKYWPWSWP